MIGEVVESRHKDADARAIFKAPGDVFVETRCSYKPIH